jgi:mutator protein MutT
MLTIQDFENRFRGYEPGPQDISGTYAVLVPLVERNGELCLLFEMRSGNLAMHAGEVGFPGGRMENGETPEQCALRETKEELGIASSEIQIISRLDYIAHHTNMFIYPILARLEPQALDYMVISSDEVSDTFLVPVNFFLEHPPTVYVYNLIPMAANDFPYEYVGYQGPYHLRGTQVVVPVYDKYDRYAVWGLTGRIVRRLIQVISAAKEPGDLS